MDLHDYSNVKRVLRNLSKKWRVPIWKAEQIVQDVIDKTWEKSIYDPKQKTLLDTYFPAGKPTPQQYILRLGQAHERNEYIPLFLEDNEQNM